MKASEKKQAEWTLSTAVGRLRTEEEIMHELRQERQGIQSQISSATEQTVTVSEMMIYQSYLEHIETKISRKREEVHAAQQNVNQRQEVLSGKMVEEKVWMNAREKAKQQFIAEMLKKEQEALDEMASVRHRSPV